MLYVNTCNNDNNNNMDVILLHVLGIIFSQKVAIFRFKSFE